MPLTRGEILFDPKVTGSGSAGGQVILLDGDESASVTLKCPNVVTTTYTITLPVDPPTNNYFLQSDSSGQLSWASFVAAAAGSNTEIQFNIGGSLSASSALTFDTTNSVLFVGGNATTSAEIRLGEDTDNGSNYSAFKAAASLENNNTYTLPSTIGSAGQVLKIAASPTPTATEATLFWDSPVTGNTAPLGPSGTVQLSDGSAGFLTYTYANFNYNTGTSTLSINNTLSLTNGTQTTTIGAAAGVNVATGGDYKINGTSVLTSTTLGSGVTTSSLTSVGTLTSLTLSGNITSSTANSDLILNPNGTGAVAIRNTSTSSAGTLKFFDNDETNFVALAAPATIATDFSITLPTASPAVKSYMAFASGSPSTSSFVNAAKILNVVIDGGASPITTGEKAYIRIVGAHNVASWNLLVSNTPNGSITVRVDKDPTTTWTALTRFDVGGLTVSATGVTPTATTRRSSGTASSFNNSGNIDDGDVLTFTVTACTNIVLATLTLELIPL